MFTLIRNLGLRRTLLAEGPWLILSLVVSELFYKFHSFTLEAGAFLLTWLALSCVASLAGQFAQPRRTAGSGLLPAQPVPGEDD